MLAGINSLFCFMGWHDLRVKTIKFQRQVFYPEEKELTRKDYERLCQAALKAKDERLYLILQTICATGIRVSELKFITVESLFDKTLSQKDGGDCAGILFWDSPLLGRTNSSFHARR